jgi:hypothetical protein
MITPTNDRKQSGRKPTKEIILHKAVMPRKSTMPILQNAVVKDGIMCSTDLDITILSKTDMPDGLYKIVGSKWEKSDMSSDKFPIVPDPYAREYDTEIVSDRLLWEIEKTMFAVSSETRKPAGFNYAAFNNVCIRVADGVATIFCSDSTMIINKVVNVHQRGDNIELRISPKVFKLLLKDKASHEISIASRGNALLLTNGNISIMAGKIPYDKTLPYYSIYGDSVESTLRFDKNVLLYALNELGPCSDKATGVMIYGVKGGKCEMGSYGSITTDKYAITIDAEISTKKIKVAPENKSYLMPLRHKEGYVPKREYTTLLSITILKEILGSLDGDYVYLGINGRNQGVVISDIEINKRSIL